MISVTTTELRRDYGERTALRGITFELAEGQTLAVLGPNGAGKSTLLRILATLLRPTSGDVSVLGQTLPREAWRARGRIGYLGHSPLLYRDLTVAENLAFHARLHKLGPKAGARAVELLEQVGMAARAGELVSNLSRGMAQRAGVCRLLLHEPDLLLLDEPYAHLDPEGAALVEPLLGPAPGRTRVLVTHDPGAGLQGADRVLGLSHSGEMAYEGAAGELDDAELRAIYQGAVR